MYFEPSVTVMVMKGMLKLETSTAFQLALIYNIHVSNNLWKTHEHDFGSPVLQPLDIAPIICLWFYKLGTNGKWVEWEY